MIFPVASRDVWRQMRALFRELKISTDRIDDTHQVLITKWHRFPSISLPQASTLKLPGTLVPVSVQLHLYVAPGLEPARVAVGSILQVDDPVARARATIYSYWAFEDWMFGKLSERLRAKPEPLDENPTYRAEQTRRLMPAGLDNPCETQMANRTEQGRREFKPPRVMSQVDPVYPGPEFAVRSESVIRLEGEVTEHGTFIHARQIKSEKPPDNFSTASYGAAALWRFEPAFRDGCPTLGTATIEMGFGMKK